MTEEVKYMAKAYYEILPPSPEDFWKYLGDLSDSEPDYLKR